MDATEDSIIGHHAVIRPIAETHLLGGWLTKDTPTLFLIPQFPRPGSEGDRSPHPGTAFSWRG